MSHARTQHPNAPLTPEGRRRMVACVLEGGWTIEATAERFQIDAKTVTKWRDRFRTEGDAGLSDRSSRPRTSSTATPPEVCARVLELRRQRRWGANHIGHEVGLAASTVQRILGANGVGRLDVGDRATARPVIRYQRDRPGELIHVDVKKIAGIPDGGGWRIHGRGQASTAKRSTTGYRFIRSTTGPASSTPRSSTTNKESPRPGSGIEPLHGSTPTASRVNESSPTMVRATSPGCGTGPVTPQEPPSRRLDRDAPRPTAKSNASTGPCSKNGPTSDPGPQNPHATPDTTPSPTSTITTEHTAPSTGQHQPPPSTTFRTTSPKTTRGTEGGDCPVLSCRHRSGAVPESGI